LVGHPEKGLHVFFWKCWVPLFEMKQCWATFCPKFQWFSSNFWQWKTWEVRFHPTSYDTLKCVLLSLVWHVICPFMLKL